MHTVISGPKGDNKVTCSAANLFFPLTASKSMEANKWHCIYRGHFSYFEKTVFIVCEFGFSVSFVLQESIGFSSYGF